MNWSYKLKHYATLHYRKKILHKIIPPSYILWDCTRQCNLMCEHCGATKESYNQELTFDEIKKVISDIALMKTQRITTNSIMCCFQTIETDLY